jgi:hypothetical protein
MFKDQMWQYYGKDPVFSNENNNQKIGRLFRIQTKLRRVPPHRNAPCPTQSGDSQGYHHETPALRRGYHVGDGRGLVAVILREMKETVVAGVSLPDLRMENVPKPESDCKDGTPCSPSSMDIEDGATSTDAAARDR